MLEEGEFYPRRTMSAEERLWWYARFFDSVEVNSSFYALPSTEVTTLWVADWTAEFVHIWRVARGRGALIVAAAGNGSRRGDDPRFTVGASPPAAADGHAVPPVTRRRRAHTSARPQ